MNRRLTLQTEHRWATDGSGRRFGGRRFTRRMPRLKFLPWPIALVLLLVVCVALGQLLGEFLVVVFTWVGRTAVRALDPPGGGRHAVSDEPLTPAAVVAAGFGGDEATARTALASADPRLRVCAVGALHRLGILDAALVAVAVADPAPAVRRRVAGLVPPGAAPLLVGLLDDPDPLVAESAAWALGEAGDDAIAARAVGRLARGPAGTATRSCGRRRSPRSERSATRTGEPPCSPPAPTSRRCGGGPSWRWPRSRAPRWRRRCRRRWATATARSARPPKI